MSAPQLRTATSEDTQSIRVLLENNGLPTRDLISSKPQFIVACEGQAIVAAGALQRFASSALLRSVAVAPHRRGRGLGRILVEELERIFEHQGYRVIERHEVPQDVQRSEEFRSLCPASPACMAKALTDASWRGL